MTDILWDVIKGLLATGVGLGLWVVRQQINRISALEAHLEALKEELVILREADVYRKARYELWLELNKPERRNGGEILDAARAP